MLNKNYDERCDVWSVGVILYILLSGKPPFDGDDDHEITEQVKIGNYNMSGGIWEVLSTDAKRLIRGMLTYNYKNRISAKEALNDPWFKNASTKQVDVDLMQESLKNLAKFSATQKLQQATMSMMVQNMVTKEEVARLQQVFVQLDTNKDGKLQYEEVLAGYEQFYGDMAKDEVDRIFSLVDVDNSGEIDFSEFVTATVDKGKLLQEEKLRAACGHHEPAVRRTMEIHVAEEARHISFAGEFLRVHMPLMSARKRALCTLRFPVVMKLLANAIMIPPRGFAAECGNPEVDAAIIAGDDDCVPEAAAEEA